MLTTPGVAERNEGTFRALCDKHPSEPHTEIVASLETTLCAPTDCHVASAVRIGKVDNPFDPEAVRATVMRANPTAPQGLLDYGSATFRLSYPLTWPKT